MIKDNKISKFVWNTKKSLQDIENENMSKKEKELERKVELKKKREIKQEEELAKHAKVIERFGSDIELTDGRKIKNPLLAYVNKISYRSKHFLRKENIFYLEDLILAKEKDLFSITGLGNQSIKEIIKYLEDQSLKLEMKYNSERKITIVKNMTYEDLKSNPIYQLNQNSLFLSYIPYKDRKKTFSRSYVRLKKLIGRDILIKDLNEDLLVKAYTTKKIGKRTTDLIKKFIIPENILEIISAKKNQNFKLSESPTTIESVIIKDIESLLERLDSRSQDIFVSRYGYKTQRKTLEETAEKFGITRERIRQLQENVINLEIKLGCSFAEDFIFSYLKSKESIGFHKTFKKLDEAFIDKDDSSRVEKSDIVGDLLVNFLEIYSGVDEGTYKTPERELLNFERNLLQEIWTEVSSPISIDNFTVELGRVYGYNDKFAKAAIEFMKNNNLIEIKNDKIKPIHITKINELEHILLKFPKGLFWKDILKIGELSPTKNNFLSHRISPPPILTHRAKNWLCNRGTYKHIKYLKLQEKKDEIMQKTISIMKKNKKKTFSCEEVYLVFKYKNKGLSINYYEFRAFIKLFGLQYGIYHKGKSASDSISLAKDFKKIKGIDKVLEIVNNANKAIHEDEINKNLRKSKVSSTIIHWINYLITNNKIFRVGPKLYFSKEKAIKMCDENLVKSSLDNLMNRFKFISDNYITKYVNDELNYSFSSYYYDSLISYLSNKHGLNYANGFLSKTSDKISIGEIVDNYFDNKKSIINNYKFIFNEHKIAITKVQLDSTLWNYRDSITR